MESREEEIDALHFGLATLVISPRILFLSVKVEAVLFLRAMWTRDVFGGRLVDPEVCGYAVLGFRIDAPERPRKMVVEQAPDSRRRYTRLLR